MMKHYEALKRNRRDQQGQALTELVICLVAILSVLSGFLLISALGIENINVSILARQNADKKARSGLLSSSSGQSIQTWNAGRDGIEFTNDDNAVRLTDTSGSVFTDELRDNSGKLDLTSEQTLHSIPDNNNFAVTLDDGRLFLMAAALGHNQESETDPLGKWKLNSLKELISTLIIRGEFLLQDTAFMPSHNPILDNQYHNQFE